MNLRENIKKELKLLSEQGTGPWTGTLPTGARGFRSCKCTHLDANGTCDTWFQNYLGNADGHFTSWNTFFKIAGQLPQVGDVFNVFGADRYIDRVNDNVDINCYMQNGVIGQACANPTYYYGQGARELVTNQVTYPVTNPNSACGVSTTPPCFMNGCTDPTALNYNSTIDPNCDDGSCIFPYQVGCTDPSATNYSPQATIDDGSCIFTQPCDTTPGSPCAQQWFQNPNASWASTWINNRDCSNYTWPSTNLETDALSLMASAPNPQPNIYNNWNDIWNAGNAGWPNTTGAPKTQFIGRMAKAKYSQCQKQACNC